MNDYKRLDRPDGEWLWRREMRVAMPKARKPGQPYRRNKRQPPRPHIVFNERALPLEPGMNRILEFIEAHPDGVTLKDMVAGNVASSNEVAKAQLWHLRDRMKKAFGQDLLTGQAGDQGPPGDRAQAVRRLTFIRL